MRRSAVLVVLVAGLSLALAAVSVLAGPMQSVQISVLTDLDTLPSVPDPFAASGPAVATGVLCATGTVFTGPYNWPPPPSGSVVMVKYFICADGTFDVELRVWLLAAGNTKGIWKVIGGSGSYAHLNGHGTLTGTYDPATNDVLDIYTGKMAIAGPPPTFPPPWAGGK
ncbi:hypothetical protein ACFLSF_00350 [Candidatus Bipolaricaulota bacterium]